MGRVFIIDRFARNMKFATYNVGRQGDAHENHFFICVIILLGRANYLDNAPSI